MSMQDAILDRVRSKQSRIVAAGHAEVESTTGPPLGSVRFVLEFPDNADAAAVSRTIRESMGIEVQAKSLSAAHGEGGDDGEDRLARFVVVTVPRISQSDLEPSAFEFGYAMADATGAVTAEPELGTDFYIPDHFDGGEQTESVGGCWVDAGLDPTRDKPLWAVEKVRATAAWKLPPEAAGKAKGASVRIFQPDTGVADHSELGEGMLDLTDAYDFVEEKKGAHDPLDYRGNPGHGTGTASVVAGRGRSGRMSGAAPAATLVPLRAIERVVVFDHGRVAAAVEYARRKKADVITMSLGGAWSSALKAAIAGAIADGVIVLAAAGNCVKVVVWPARYEEVIAVAGCNIDDHVWQGSCHGDAVDITAPAEFVPRANRATDNDGSPTDVRGGQGTSFAVALTAGVAALWLGHHGKDAILRSLAPGETVQNRFAEVLKCSSRRPVGWETSEFGAGIVDAERMLRLPLDNGGTSEGTLCGSDADGLRSVRTLLDEVGGGIVAEHAAGASRADERRFAAELSHLALAARRRRRGDDQAGNTEGVSGSQPSETLRRALDATGRAGLLEGLR